MRQIWISSGVRRIVILDPISEVARRVKQVSIDAHLVILARLDCITVQPLVMADIFGIAALIVSAMQALWRLAQW